jgi:glycosyltransferase involved in cell wall biosynthesis
MSRNMPLHSAAGVELNSFSLTVAPPKQAPYPLDAIHAIHFPIAEAPNLRRAADRGQNIEATPSKQYAAFPRPQDTRPRSRPAVTGAASDTDRRISSRCIRLSTDAFFHRKIDMVIARPKLTVAMTTYNGAIHLRETIDSILNQTFADFEFVIIDDASDDDTRGIIESYDDKRLRLIANSHNVGISESRNKAFALARGQYIATTDQDDISEPSRLALQVGYLDDHPDIGMVASAVVDLVDGRLQYSDTPIYACPAEIEFALFFGRHNVTYSSLCTRIDSLRQLGQIFRPRFHYAEDFELYHRFAKHGKIAILPDILVTYRVHHSNTSKTQYVAMSDNGRAFLSTAYQDLLQREISDSEIRSVWRVFVEKRPAADLEELQRMGDILEDVLNVFLASNRYAATEVAAVRTLAAQIWWSSLQASSKAIGAKAFRELARCSRMGPWTPPLRSRLEAMAKALTPPRHREKT